MEKWPYGTKWWKPKRSFIVRYFLSIWCNLELHLMKAFHFLSKSCVSFVQLELHCSENVLASDFQLTRTNICRSNSWFRIMCRYKIPLIGSKSLMQYLFYDVGWEIWACDCTLHLKESSYTEWQTYFASTPKLTKNQVNCESFPSFMKSVGSFSVFGIV